MNQLFSFFVPCRSKNLIGYLLMLMFACPTKLLAQTTIATVSDFTNDSVVTTVTFNFQNANNYPVIITGIEGVLNNYGVATAELWYRTTPVISDAGSISSTNGWTQVGTASINGIPYAVSNVSQSLLSGLTLTIPPYSTYGMAVAVYNSTGGVQGVGNAAATFTDGAGGCYIFSGNYNGYSSNSMPPSAALWGSKGWMGKVTFIPVQACSGTPSVANISGPATVCTNAKFDLSASNYDVGGNFTYQWQKYNTSTATWNDIALATAPDYNCSGIATSTQFRFRTTCTGSNSQSFSNTLTVNIGTGFAGGSYTINNNAPSSASNFRSFSAAAAAMQCGIAGPVVFNVSPASDIYNEQVFFNNIQGTGSVNTIRINGNGALLQSYSRNTDSGILNFKGIKYITIDGLTIRSLGVYNVTGVSFTDSASHDSLTNCFVDLRSITDSSGGIGVALSSSFSMENGYPNVVHCYLGNNHILGSDSAMGLDFGVLEGSYPSYSVIGGPALNTGNVIDHNEIENCHEFGISSYSSIGTTICYNDIHRTNKETSTLFLGISCQGRNPPNDTAVNTLTIVGNRIHNASKSTLIGTFWGIFMANILNGSADHSNKRSVLIANNAMYNINCTSGSINTFNFGIMIQDGNGTSYNSPLDLRVFHNTIDLSEITGNDIQAGLVYSCSYSNVQTAENVDIENNIITFKGANSLGYKAGFSLATLLQNLDHINVDMQRNVVHYGETGPMQYFCFTDNVNYSTLQNFQAAFPQFENGSISVDPQYTASSTGNLKPLNTALLGNGANLQTYVPKDILGVARPAAPTPGAFEAGVVTGITNTETNDLISIYPNPANDFLQVQSKSDIRLFNVTVYNASGRQIFYKAFHPTGEINFRLSTARFINGLYSIRMETNKGTIVQKFEIVR